MAKRAADQEEAQAVEPVTHPEEIRFEAELTIAGRPTARAALRTTPAGVSAQASPWQRSSCPCPQLRGLSATGEGRGLRRDETVAAFSRAG